VFQHRSRSEENDNNIGKPGMMKIFANQWKKRFFDVFQKLVAGRFSSCLLKLLCLKKKCPGKNKESMQQIMLRDSCFVHSTLPLVLRMVSKMKNPNKSLPQISVL